MTPQKLFLRSDGMAVEPTEPMPVSFEKRDPDCDCYECIAYRSHLSSLPAISVRADYRESHAPGWLNDDWEYGYEVDLRRNGVFILANKAIYDTELPRDRRLVIIPRRKEEVKKHYWYCPKCQCEVDDRNVTFGELHDTCNSGVVIRPANSEEKGEEPQEPILTPEDVLDMFLHPGEDIVKQTHPTIYNAAIRAMKKYADEQVLEYAKGDDSTPPVASNEQGEGKCETGCKKFTGGEVKHHLDCFFYPHSMSEQLDKVVELLRKEVEATGGSWTVYCNVNNILK